MTRTYVIALCSLLSPLLGALASVVPPPWSWVLAALALVSAGVAGLVSKVPAFLVGRPVVSAVLAGPLAVLATVLADQALATQDGLERAGMLAVAVLLSGLAGKPLPSPGAPTAAALRLVPLLLFVSSLAGCATSFRPAGGAGAFGFRLTPGQCAQLQKERRSYRAAESTSVYVAGAGALVSALALAVSDEKTAPAISTGVALAAGGVSAFTNSQVSDLDQELAVGGCGR